MKKQKVTQGTKSNQREFFDLISLIILALLKFLAFGIVVFLLKKIL